MFRRDGTYLLRAEQRGCRVDGRRGRRVGKYEQWEVVELKLRKVIVRRSFREAELMQWYYSPRSGHWARAGRR
jgi:hypothetical protein